MVYVLHRDDDKVSIIDGSDNSIIDTIDVEERPESVAVNPETNIVYILHCSARLMLIEGSDNSIIDIISLGFTPAGNLCACNPLESIAVNKQTWCMWVAPLELASPL